MDDFGPPAVREFLQVGDGQYRLTIGSVGVSLDVDRLRRERHELVGELTVRCTLPGARTVDGTLSVGTFNLSSPTARTQRAKLLRDLSESELDFVSYLEELCQRTIAAERNGSPSRPLTEYDIADRPAEIVIDPDRGALSWRVLADHPTILFGDGGSGKSFIELYALGRLTQQGLVTLLVDWELTGEEHHKRLRQLFPEKPPVVHYLRADRPIADEADRIAREVRRLGVDYIAYDSVAFACAGAPEAAEEASVYFRTIRHIGVGSLNLAHVTKAENGDHKPFGSTFWHNGARSTYFVKVAEAGSDVKQVGLINRKANLTALRDYAYQFTFEPTSIDVQPIALGGVQELASSQVLWRRLMGALKHATKPMTIAELATSLEAKKDTIQKTLNRMDMFTRVDSQDGIQRWALAEVTSSAA